jgi:hypothetical protein
MGSTYILVLTLSFTGLHWLHLLQQLLKYWVQKYSATLTHLTSIYRNTSSICKAFQCMKLNFLRNSKSYDMWILTFFPIYAMTIHYIQQIINEQTSSKTLLDSSQSCFMDLLTRDDHTPSPGAPYAKPGLHLIRTKACLSIWPVNWQGNSKLSN